MYWWKKSHFELILSSSQAVEAARASELCEENIRSFYKNLEELYTMHEYPFGNATRLVPKKVSSVPSLSFCHCSVIRRFYKDSKFHTHELFL